MKKVVLILIILVSLLLTGCVLDEYLDKMKDEDTNDISVVEEYLPSPISGTTRNWHSEIQNNVTGTTDTSSFTETITDPVTIGEHDYYTITDSREMASRKFCVEDNGIYFLIESTMFPVLGTNPDTPFNTNAMFFDFSGKHVSEYDIVDWGTEIEDYYINYYFKGIFIGYESVVTDKGNNYLCPKFQITYETIFTPKETGDTTHYKRVERYWFAPGIGRIKKTIDIYEESVLTTSEVDMLIE